MKNIYLLGLLSLILSPSVFGIIELQSFNTQITVSIGNQTFNITTEQGITTYESNISAINTFTLTIYRNITIGECGNLPEVIGNLTGNIGNFTQNVNNLINTCDTITKQYGDTNTYFKLYTTCNVENELCKKEKEDINKKITELSGYKTDFDTCNSNYQESQNVIRDYTSLITSYQQNITATHQEVNKMGSQRFLFGIVGMLIIGLLWFNKNRKLTPSPMHTKILRK